MAVADNNNSFATAKNLGTLSNTVRSAFGDIGFVFKQGRRSTLDRQDFHYFRVIRSNKDASITLGGLKQDADLTVYSESGRRIGLSTKSGRTAEAVTLSNLAVGIYYVKVTPGTPKAKTTYQLSVSGSAVNTAPTVTTSRLTAKRGSLTPASTTITNAVLNATDSLSNASQLTYTLTTQTQSGSLFRNGVPLGVGSTFTQADINNGLVAYQQQIIKAIPNSEGVVGNPVISGSNVAWISGTGTSADVYFYNGTSGTTTRLTNDGLVNSNVQISGSNVVWDTTYSSGERDVQYSINGGALISINTSTSFDDFNPKISGSRIAFQRDDLSPTDAGDGIYQYDVGTQTAYTRMPDSELGTNRTLAGISSSNSVIWTATFGTAPNTERDVYFYNTSSQTTTVLDSSSDFDDSSPLISSTHIAFKRNQLSGNTSDGVYLYTINSGTSALLPSSNLVSPDELSLRDISPDSSNVVWSTFSNNVEKAYFYNGTQTAELTAVANGRGYYPSISITNIAFRQNFSNTNGVWLYYSTNGTYQHISTDFSAPFISNQNIVWKNVSADNSARLLFYDGAATNDSFGFTVTDGALSRSGTLSIV